MKMISFLPCVLAFLCIANAIASEGRRDDEVQREFLNEFAIDESIKAKRPFCNTFTGCGRKRNFARNLGEVRYVGKEEGIPSTSLSVYKALIKATPLKLRNAIYPIANGYQIRQVTHTYDVPFEEVY